METENAKYNCPRCHYKTDDKFNYLKHLNRKKPCQTLYSSEQRSEIITAITLDKEFKCDKCPKSFSQIQGLCRHKKVHANEHSVAITNNENSNNTTNNEHSHNTNIDSHDHINNITIEHLTIQLLPFGKEDMSTIQNDQEFLNKCIQQGIERAIPLIVKQIFLNKELPQNMNVKMGTNHEPAEMMVFREDIQSGEPSWEHAPRAAVLQELVVKGADVLQTHNSHLYHISEKTLDDSDDYDRRNGKLINAKANKRGTGKIKTAVLDRIKDHEKNSEV